MKQMGAAVYSALSDKSKFAGLVDRKRNPHWAKMQRQVIGKYLDAVAEPWNEARDVFHAYVSRRTSTYLVGTEETKNYSGKTYTAHLGVLSSRKVGRALELTRNLA